MKLVDYVALEVGCDTCSGEIILEDDEGAWATLDFHYDRRGEVLKLSDSAPEDEGFELSAEERKELLEELHERMSYRRDRVREVETQPVVMRHKNCEKLWN